MSHNFKAPASIDPAERRAERQVNFMAANGVRRQADLDKLLEGAAPAMRDAMIERIRPMLSFEPEATVTEDCPNCGLRRGSVMDHACSE